MHTLKARMRVNIGGGITPGSRVEVIRPSATKWYSVCKWSQGVVKAEPPAV
jgi:hypothetical protein